MHLIPKEEGSVRYLQVQSRCRGMTRPLSIYWPRRSESGLQCVCVNTRSSWLITHGPSEPFPFSQPVTHVQTNQLQGQHLSQPQRRYSRLKFTTVFTPQDRERSLCFHSAHRQASTIDLSWNTRFHQVWCPGNNSICLFLRFHISQVKTGSKSSWFCCSGQCRVIRSSLQNYTRM